MASTQVVWWVLWKPRGLYTCVLPNAYHSNPIIDHYCEFLKSKTPKLRMGPDADKSFGAQRLPRKNTQYYYFFVPVLSAFPLMGPSALDQLTFGSCITAPNTTNFSYCFHAHCHKMQRQLCGQHRLPMGPADHQLLREDRRKSNYFEIRG
jgi:hypothetical protein